MSGWLYLRHEETGGATRIPDDEAVLRQHEARGWAKADVPEAVPFAPEKADRAPGDEGMWVDLVHPDLPTGRHRLPNNDEALQGAFEAGWRLPDPPAEAVDEAAQQIREEHGKRRGRPTKAELAEAEEVAARQAASTDEGPSALEPVQSDPAGDGNEAEGVTRA